MSNAIEWLREECAELETVLRDLSEEEWQRATEYKDWTIADQVMHLHQIDNFGIIAVTTPEQWPDYVKTIRAYQAGGLTHVDKMREAWGSLSSADLLALWSKGWREIAERLEGVQDGGKLPWFGPDMRPASFAGARQMEVWAHGQRIYDLLGLTREPQARIKAICELGVRTQGWTFRNRELDRPDPPRIELTGPNGELWVWNEEASERVSGPALDFALAVVQSRNVHDTQLQTDGDGARAWMEIAQCFAGPPADPPARGTRKVPVN
ncbi:MAG: TIGR03084 family protein [Sphingomonadaceae bacterium]|nr:TIGR03084 family protein [Sphingomonadaceae bacterium]